MRPPNATLVGSVLSFALASATALPAARAEPKLTLHGFADSSIGYHFVPKAAAKEGVSLGLDQVELDVEATIGAGLRLRTDLQVFPGEEPSDRLFDQLVEQAYAEFFFNGSDKGFFLRAGKWNAPVGFEVVDPTDLWQYSHGLLFTFCDPTNLTGFALGWVGASTQVQLWVTNDWDQPTTPKKATIGGRFQQGLGDVGTVGVSTTLGPMNDADMRFMADLDLSLAFGDLKLAGEFNFGLLANQQSIGFLLAANYAFTEQIGMTLRYDYLDRATRDAPYKGMTLTLAGLFELTEGLDVVAEVRGDFQEAKEDAVGGALEVLGSF